MVLLTFVFVQSLGGDRGHAGVLAPPQVAFFEQHVLPGRSDLCVFIYTQDGKKKKKNVQNVQRWQDVTR